MASAATTRLQVTSCPECGLPAEIVARHVLESTAGPVEHARVQCVDRHVFNLPVAMLVVPGGGRRAGRADSSRDPAPTHRR